MTNRLAHFSAPAMFGFRLACACGVLIVAVVVVLGLVVSGVIE